MPSRSMRVAPTAIWVLLGEQNPEFGVSTWAQMMIDAAKGSVTGAFQHDTRAPRYPRGTVAHSDRFLGLVVIKDRSLVPFSEV